MNVEYLQTLDFAFRNIDVMNVRTERGLMRKIRRNEILKIYNDDEIEYINSTYVMYFKL